MAKKIELPHSIMSHYCNAGEIVLDLFGHSGSTLMAAEQLGMNCVIIDIEPKYVQAMIDRFSNEYKDYSVEKLSYSG